MSVNWDEVRSRWNCVRGDVGRRHLPSDEHATRGRFGLAVNPVAITGEAGAGKSELADALVRTYVSGERKRSPDSEDRRAMLGIGAHRTRVSIKVIPGQESVQRAAALAETMEGGASPHGVIHVVCWGHTRIWKHSGQRVIGEQLRAEEADVDRESVRRWHLRDEVAEFKTLCDRLIDANSATRLRWLIIAVSKADLYWDRIDEACDYYIPGGSAESAFTALMRDLAEETSLELGVLPMSSRLVNHDFLAGQPSSSPLLDELQRDILRSHFTAELRARLISRRG